MSSHCQLCGASRATQQLNRSCGLAMCDACYGGHFQPALDHLGVGYQVERGTRRVRTGDNSYTTYHTLEITAMFPSRGQNLEGVFAREKGLAMMRKLLDTVGFGDPKVGDPLFDDYVKIRAAKDGPMMDLLRQSEGLQNTIMELLGEEGIVELRDGRMSIEVAEQNTPPDELEPLRATLAIAAHLALAGQ